MSINVGKIAHVFFYKCIPISGCISYELFALRILSPQLFKSVFGDGDVIAATSSWFNAHIGIGLYVYSRQHLQNIHFMKKIIYCVFGTAIFNFGSVLFWATSKPLLADDVVIRPAFALISGGTLLRIGISYLQHIDTSVSTIK